VKVVKDHFQEKGSAADIIDKVTGKHSQTSIRSFVCDHVKWTKQNIYMFTLNRKFVRTDITSFHYAVEKESNLGAVHQICLLPEATYSVYLSNPISKQDIIFLLPVVLKVHNKSLTIHFTKLEKKISSYFLPNREAKQASILNDEDEVLRKVLAKFEAHYTVERVDFNKGIKKLWDNNDIDCHKIQWRKSASIAIEVMDGNLTFKQKYPTEYLEIIKAPIENTTWKYLQDDRALCDKFTANPTKGTLGISHFPDDDNQVSNVITRILTNN
jgi:hypothetical protein